MLNETANNKKPSSCFISLHPEFVNFISQGRKTNQKQLYRNTMMLLPSQGSVSGGVHSHIPSVGNGITFIVKSPVAKFNDTTSSDVT